MLALNTKAEQRMLKEIGKNRRWKNNRSSSIAEAYALAMLDNVHREGMFNDEGEMIQPVVERYFLEHCTNRRRFRNPKTGKWIEVGGDQIKRHLSEALLGLDGVKWVPGESELSKRHFMAKRWSDVSPEGQAKFILYALKLQRLPHAQLTVWIGSDLVRHSIQAGRPLAEVLLKKIREALPSVLGDVQFGVWFHIEHVPFNPEQLHAHGVMYVEEPEWLKDNHRKNERLRAALRSIAGDDGSKGNNWLELKMKEMNAYWIGYSRKGAREKPTASIGYQTPSLEFGESLEATSRCLSRIGKDFYDRMRPFLNACMTNEVVDWNEADWNAVGVDWDRDLLTAG